MIQKLLILLAISFLAGCSQSYDKDNAEPSAYKKHMQAKIDALGAK